MRRSISVISATLLWFLTVAPASAQFDSGSDGTDGALAPLIDTVIDMADHPDGIYQYVSVNIPLGVTVTFIPNANSSPITWLVQDSCVIDGVVSVRGGDIDSRINGAAGARGGPGGFRGGTAPLGEGTSLPGSGLGPGGGKVSTGELGGNGSFGTKGGETPTRTTQHPSGDVYGNQYLLPLMGGSGGGGGSASNVKNGGGGGGGAILIAAEEIRISGLIDAQGGGVNNGTSSACSDFWIGGGAGSGGGIRLIAGLVTGTGALNVTGQFARYYWQGGCLTSKSGSGRIRIEGLTDTFNGSVTSGVTTRGFTGIISLPSNLHPSCMITSMAGIAIPSAPTGSGSIPDVMIPAAVENPISIDVSCTNIPLNSAITIEAKPASGPAVSALANNTSGNFSSSMAIGSLSLPSGGGTITARVTVPFGTTGASIADAGEKPSVSQTGLATNGERFVSAEITAVAGGGQEIVYVTESGARYPLRVLE